MDSNQLMYLAHLSETTSLTKVAEHFFTSHQVVKKAIANLEDELNVTLIQTTNQGTQLTEAGLCVVKYARTFFDGYMRLQSELQAFIPVKEEITELHLYVTPNMSTEYCLDLYDSFFDKQSHANLVVHFSTFPKMLDEAQQTQNNIYLFPISYSEKIKQLLYNLAKEHQLASILFPPSTNYICMHKSSKYAKILSPSFEDLKDAPLYVFLNTNPLCLSDDESALTLQYFSDYSILKRFIKKNQALGIIKKKEFKYYFGENTSEYVLRPLKDSTTQYTVMVSEKLLATTPVVQEFIWFLQNEWKE